MIDRMLPIWLIVFILAACGRTGEQPVFELIDPSVSGVTFSNELSVTPEFNILNYMYFYNGGGVSAGDFNNDGLVDLYFTSNQDSNRLYLNTGNFRFRDVTKQAQVFGISDAWTTGTTTVDINADGLLDLYVSVLGNYQGYFATNQLFVNQGNDEEGIPVFREEAAKYGLDLVGFGTQAAFFDLDLDGDLDMFQLNHSVHSNGTFVEKSSLQGQHHRLAGDRLLRNDNGQFIDITLQAGINSNQLGYGLGLGIADVNDDGYPDIYVGNDFHEDDYLYINNQDGTFTDRRNEQIRVTSRYSMGNDLADVNNDGHIDIFSADMLPADYKILKASQTEDSYHIYSVKHNMGYNHQYSRNTLQLNHGAGSFSEVSMYSGVAASDWSWSPLIADFDLDGWPDIFVSNGIVRRPNDLDYINYLSNEANQLKLQGTLTERDLALIDRMPEVKLVNAMFVQQNTLDFSDMSLEWGLGQPSYSSGACYADLDNDGDPDLIVSNTGAPAFIYKNNSNGDGNNFLKVRLSGAGQNPQGIGTRVEITTTSGEKMVRQAYATRGFQSSGTTDLFFGLGRDSVRLLTVRWPTGEMQKKLRPLVNTTLTLDQNEANRQKQKSGTDTQPVFVPDSLAGLDYSHDENTSFIEFSREALIPHMQSAEGPGVAVGDIDGNGWDDIYLGGAKHQPGRIYCQDETGIFRVITTPFMTDALQEDVQAEFIDIDQDEDPDLIVLTGGNEFYRGEEAMVPKVYINHNGKFTKQPGAMNGITLTGGAMAFEDFDKDGDQDVFIGARSEPWQYGVFPNSYFLINDGHGHYTIEKETTIAMMNLGMVKAALWTDVDGNGFQDLVEWFPITVFLNDGKKLTRSDPGSHGMEKTGGFWNSLLALDLDGDGDNDLVAGNIGLNTRFVASEDHPIKMYVRDFDGNGKTDQLLYIHTDGEDRLFASKDELGQQMVFLNRKFNSYKKFSEADQGEIIPAEELRKATLRKAYELRSCVFLNKGEGVFEKVPLPGPVQFSTVNTIQSVDYDENGTQDLLMAGNYYPVSTQIGRYDASYGALVKNNGDRTFSYISNLKSGLRLSGQVRMLKRLKTGKGEMMLVIKNNDRPEIIRHFDARSMLPIP